MKIALVVPGGVDRSGTHRVIPAVLALIKRLAQRHELHVFAVSQEPRAARWELLGAQIHNVSMRMSTPRAIAAIRREHSRRPFDIVQSLWSGKCGFIAVSAARLIRRPSLVHVAGGELTAIPDIGYGRALYLRARIVERHNLRGATEVSAASTPLIESIRRLGVEARRVPLGVDLDVWPPRAPVPRGASPAQLVHVASLNRVKDQPTLFAALALLKERGRDFRMSVIGEDTLRGAMHELIVRLGLADRVSLLGFRTHRELHALVAAAHINVVSSRHEAGPLVVLEAAVAGVPTVGTAVGHVVEWSSDAAIAVPVRDARALAAAIESLLDDESRRLALAVNAQRLAVAQDADFTARAFEEIHARLVGP